MDRRNKARHNLQLVCLAGTDTAQSAPLQGITENMSRDGILMQWLESVPLPGIGSLLTVEVPLPASPEFAPRVMSCATTVVRITPRHDGQHSVALRIDRVRFRRASKARKYDLQSMPPVTDKVS